MKSVLILSITLFFTSLSQAQQIVDRQSIHEDASDEFLSTHFFENGRGMTISPDLSVFFGGLTKKSSFLQDSIVSKRYGFLPGKKHRYVGVFEVKNIPEDQLQAVLMIECPRLLFPFMRRVISDMIREGGFPPLNLEHIDFGALYRKQAAGNQTTQ